MRHERPSLEHRMVGALLQGMLIGIMGAAWWLAGYGLMYAIRLAVS